MKSAAAKLRELLAEPNKIIVCPGIYDGFTARIALQVGFDCLYMVCNCKHFPEITLTHCLIRPEQERRCRAWGSRI